VGRKAQGFGEGVVVVAEEALMALDSHTLHPRALQDRLGGLGAAVPGFHTYFGETMEGATHLPLGPEAEEQGWDRQNEVLKVEEHGVKPGGPAAIGTTPLFCGHLI